MKILLLAILIKNSIRRYVRFDGTKNDASVATSKATPGTHPGVKENRPRKPLIKVENAQLFRQRSQISVSKDHDYLKAPKEGDSV